MQVDPTYDKPQLRQLAALISHAAFKRLASSTNQSAYIRRMKRLAGFRQLSNNRPSNLNELISFSYKILEQHYRHEYIYKNKLLNDYVLKHFALTDSVLLNEFRVGSSIADAVLINGSSKVFEIKTELDNLERLERQLADYYKAFTEIYLFTHYSLLDKYVQLIPGQVGILLYNESGDVVEFRAAKSYSQALEITCMVGSLRKPEYTKMVKRLTGSLPEATPAFFYKKCIELLSLHSTSDVQGAFCAVLKDRMDNRVNSQIQAGELPAYLNFSFYQAKYDEKAYLRLVNNLSKNIL